MADTQPEVTETPTGYNVAYPEHNVGVHSDQASTPEEALKAAEPVHADFLEHQAKRKAEEQ